MSSEPPQYPRYPHEGEQPEPQQPWQQYQPPGYAQPAYGPAPGGASPYAGWWLRVGAQLIDGVIAGIILGVIVVIGTFLAFAGAEVDPVTDEISDVNPLGVVIMGIGFLLYLAFDLWNRGVRVGAKGQSLGKQLVGIRIVRAQDGSLLGAGSGSLRWLITFLFALTSCISLVDVLWPLWDDKNQTLHDKVVGSVALRV